MSVMMSLVMPDEISRFEREVVEASADDRLLAPAVFPMELLNALRSNLRRKRIRPDDFAAMLAVVRSFAVGVATPPPEDQWLQRLEHACDADLTPYDASYLLLAEQRAATLATLDRRLAAVAASRGIDCLSR